MSKSAIPIQSIPPPANGQPAVWEFVPESNDKDETWVRPVKKLPVTSLAGRVIATHVTLANGDPVQALLSNVHLSAPAQNQHFLALSIWINQGWLHLARYHDHDQESHGPIAFAAALGLSPVAVFPIHYTLAGIIPAAYQSLIAAEPKERLSRSELIALAVQ